MTLHELLQRTQWSEVAFALRRHYPKDARDLERYLEVFEKLTRMVPEKTPFRLIIQPRQPDPDEPWTTELPANVSCAETSDSEHRPDARQWGLDFRRWSECLGMEVPMSARIAYMDAGVVAHCLWEMTWHGFDERHQRQVLTELKRRYRAPESEWLTREQFRKYWDID